MIQLCALYYCNFFFGRGVLGLCLEDLKTFRFLSKSTIIFVQYTFISIHRTKMNWLINRYFIPMKSLSGRILARYVFSRSLMFIFLLNGTS